MIVKDIIRIERVKKKNWGKKHVITSKTCNIFNGPLGIVANLSIVIKKYNKKNKLYIHETCHLQFTVGTHISIIIYIG